MESKQDVIKDFNQIANLTEKKWDHNKHYLPYLMNYLPEHCSAVLDVGCGTGEFFRLLAQRAGSVMALDFSPKMIEQEHIYGRHPIY